VGMKEVIEFLYKGFLKYQNDLGRPAKAKEFSEYLQVPSSSFSNWINGKAIPSGENLRNVAQKLGYEIYDILGEERPSPEPVLSNFPLSLRNALMEISGTISSLGIMGDSPEGVKIVKDTLAKYGYIVTDPDDIESEK
jgi:hypothetical protein